MSIAMMAATLPRMAGVSGPMKWAQQNCTTMENEPTNKAMVMFFTIFVRSVIIRMRKGVIKNISESCNMIKVATSQSSSGVATPLAATWFASVVAGSPTAPNPTATVFATRQMTAENIGLKPRPIRMAAGMATAVPKPAMPSSTPPSPHVNNSTNRPLSDVIWINCVLMVSISFVSHRML